MDEHKDFPVSDWRMQVTEGNTRLGYSEWVNHQVEADTTEEVGDGAS